MRHFIFPIKDASVYEAHPRKNSGFDEILEIGKTNEGRYAARSLLQFNLPTTLPICKFELILKVANASKINKTQSLVLFPMSSSWEEGSGYSYQNIVNEEEGVTWLDVSPVLTMPFVHTLEYPISDISLDVTDFIVGLGSNNNGFIIQFPTEDESDISNKGLLSIFSKQTHTIHGPMLVAKWEDSVFSPTGSVIQENLKISILAKPIYRVGEMVTIEVAASERYPLKTFSTIFSRFSASYPLPSESYFSIVDEQTGVVLIPFSPESRLSVVGNKNSFKFAIQGMFPRRYYRILIKVNDEIFDNNTIFTVK
jgi:hypothetical protein